MRTLSDIGEKDFVARLGGIFRSGRGVINGIGHDCAVVRVAPGCANDLILTSDAVIEGVHFLPGADPQRVGHKAMARVLSDLAAAGAIPAWALLNLVAPASTPVNVLTSTCRGAEATARRYGMSIVGGDTARGTFMELHVFGVGTTPRGTALLRSGATRGDFLYVTGSLGYSSYGRHLRFEPRVDEGLWLRKGCWATAAIDLSDGLATDLGHLCRMSRCGAIINESSIPVSRSRRTPGDRRTPVEHALFDGEDFELLFSVTPGRAKAFEMAWRRRFALPVTRIGMVLAENKKVLLQQGPDRIKALRPDGYDHFRK